MKDLKFISPFKKLCITIGNLPTAYIESMSYYEGLTFLVNYLANNVIPAVNNNSEVVKELQDQFVILKDYVDNYFENLDVQEEINNKLDEMADNGELTDIIAQYLGLAGILAYSNVADMKVAENLVEGSKCETYGYYSLGDGGAAKYNIRKVLNTDVIDESTIIALYDNTLVAELVTSEINANQFGAYGDGIHEDTTKLQELINYCENNNKTLNLVSGKTYLTDTLSITNKLSINGNMATLKAYTTNNMININYNTNEPNGIIENIILDMDYKAPIGINIINDHRRTYRHITFNNSAEDGIALYVGNTGSPAGCLFENLKGYGNKFEASQFCKIDGADTVFSNIDYECYKYGIEVNANTMFNNIHGFILGSDIYEDSYFMKLNASIVGENLYPDTQHRMFIIPNTYDISLSGITTWFNTDSVDHTQFSTPYIFYLTSGPGQMSRTTINNSTFKLPANNIYKFCNYNDVPMYGTGNVFRNTPYSFPSLSQAFTINSTEFENHLKAIIDNGNASISGYVTVKTTNTTQVDIITLTGHRGTFNDQRIACPYWTSGADNSTPSGFITVLAGKSNRTLKLYRNSNMENCNIYIDIPISSIFID